jgi:hypothetical protein
MFIISFLLIFAYRNVQAKKLYRKFFRQWQKKTRIIKAEKIILKQ